MMATKAPTVAKDADAKLEAGETKPLLEPASTKVAMLAILRLILLGSLMIMCSAAVINFNKYLIAGSFPFPTHLVLCHMASGSIFSSLTLLLAPSLFPSLQDQEKRNQLTPKFISTRVLPIALCFASSLVLSNLAYMYASVPFLQMMKESNVVIVYVLSLMCGIEAFKTRNAFVLCFIVLCTTMTVTGELNFSMKGTIIQGTCQFFESSRLVLQSILLSGPLKLDALTYNLLVMPVCFCTLAFLLGANSLHPGFFGRDLQTPQLSDFLANKYLLLANFALAFALNISISLFMKHSSALSMIMASLLKDALVVMVAVFMLSQRIANQQVVFFGLQLLGIFTWSMMKTFPDKFKDGVLAGLVNLIKA